MAALRPHREGERSSAESPEALLLSAFLETGEFQPAAYGVTDEDIDAWPQMWAFCKEYAETTKGAAPPLSLISKKFPDFELTSDVRTEYAADQVRKASFERRLRSAAGQMLMHLKDDDLTAAYEALENVEPYVPTITTPASVFDIKEVHERNNATRIPTPYRHVNAVTEGGIASAEFWVFAARSNHGKTWQLLNYCASAAKAGRRCALLSLEMPRAQVQRRSLMVMAGRDKEILSGVRSKDRAELENAVTQLRERYPGEISIFDPSDGPINTTDFVRGVAEEYDLVAIDHIGLLTKGVSAAVDDWRVQASISNQMRSISLATSTPLLAAVQINREGAKGRANAPPKIDKLWGSDAIGQDADTIITMRRWSKHVMVQSMEKVRDHEESNRFYTWFDPAHGRYGEMTYEQASMQHDADGGDYRDDD